jgi:rod shape-determining protein MreC
MPKSGEEVSPYALDIGHWTLDFGVSPVLRRPQYIAIGLVLALMLALAFLPAETTSRLKLAVGSLFLPLFGLAGSSHHLSQKTADVLTSRSELLKQNQALREENERLRIESLQAAEALRENARLREQVDWRQLQKKWTLKSATVVARDPANWWRTVQIDLGSRDGMKTNLPVLTSEGLVGRIASVSFARAQVVMIGDPDCKVPALVAETRDMGIVGAGGPLDRSLATLHCYSSKNANLKPGQNVITSDLSEIFPKGIPIGKIVDTREVEYGLYTEARVKLAVNLSALEEVWVLLP